MIQIALNWHTDVEDVHLGHAYLDVPPPLGALISCVSQPIPHVVWRVTDLMIYPAMPGSMAVVAHARRQVAQYAVFVQPAEGLFHP